MTKFSFLFIFIFFFTFTPISFAHMAVTSGTINVLMHTEPKDEPIALEKSIIHFGITDTSGKFKTQNCYCKVTIFANDKKVLSKFLLNFPYNKSLYNAYLPVIFPKIALYRIELSAVPIVEGDFAPFYASFDLRVDNSITKSDNNPVIPALATYSIILLIAAVTVLLLLRQVLQSNKK